METTVTQPAIEYHLSGLHYNWGNSTTLPSVSAGAGCQWCNGGGSITIHGGFCPKIKSIWYYENGAIQRIEFKDLT